MLELARAAAGAPPALTLHYDPSRKEAHLARLAVGRGSASAPAAFALRERPHTKHGGRYIDFLMPGIVALNLMGSGVWGIGLSIVDQRRRRLIRQLATTPMRRGDYLLSYMLSRLVFLVPEVAFLFGFGVLAFGTPSARQRAGDRAAQLARRVRVYRHRRADRRAHRERRGRRRLGELRDDADVVVLRRVLQLRAVPRELAAGDSRAAADRAHRRAARGHQRRGAALGMRGQLGVLALWTAAQLCARAADVPLDIAFGEASEHVRRDTVTRISVGSRAS